MLRKEKTFSIKQNVKEKFFFFSLICFGKNDVWGLIDDIIIIIINGEMEILI